MPGLGVSLSLYESCFFERKYLSLIKHDLNFPVAKNSTSKTTSMKHIIDINIPSAIPFNPTKSVCEFYCKSIV